MAKRARVICVFFILLGFEIRRQKYNCFPKYLIPHSRNMFPHRAKYDEVAGQEVGAACYVVVFQRFDKIGFDKKCEGLNQRFHEKMRDYPVF